MTIEFNEFDKEIPKKIQMPQRKDWVELLQEKKAQYESWLRNEQDELRTDAEVTLFEHSSQRFYGNLILEELFSSNGEIFVQDMKDKFHNQFGDNFNEYQFHNACAVISMYVLDLSYLETRVINAKT